MAEHGLKEEIEKGGSRKGDHGPEKGARPEEAFKKSRVSWTFSMNVWLWEDGKEKRRGRAWALGELMLPVGLAERRIHTQFGSRSLLLTHKPLVAQGALKPQCVSEWEQEALGCSSDLSPATEHKDISVFHRARGDCLPYPPVNREWTTRLSFENGPCPFLGTKWRASDVNMQMSDPPHQPHMRAFVLTF